MSCFVNCTATASQCSPLSIETHSTNFPLGKVRSSSPSWSAVSPHVDGSCSAFMEPIAGKPDNIGLWAEYCPMGSALPPSNVFSCIEVCDRPSCLVGCQKDHGELECVPSYSDSTLCYGPDVCEKATCDGSALLDVPPVCLDDGCPFTFLDRDESLHKNQLPANSEPPQSTEAFTELSLPCRWELPDDQCDVSFQSLNALGHHIYQDHIEPLATYVPWVENEYLPPEQPAAEYVCQWGSCRRSFLDHAALERHVKIAHISLDCRWAGCEVSKESPALLKTHVNMDHLNIDQEFIWSPYSREFRPSSAHSTYLGIDHKSGDAQDLIFGFEEGLQAPVSQQAIVESSFSQTDVHGNLRRSSYSASQAMDSSIGHSNNQIGWAISPVVRPAPSTHSLSSSLSILQEPSQAQLPFLLKGSSKTTNVNNDHSHTCHWLIDQALSQICGASFTDANLLQTHVNGEHISHIGGDGILCNWQDCKRNRGPKPSFPNKEKLKRHVWTHTGCMCCLIFPSMICEAV